MTSVQVPFLLIFAVVQLSAAEYVVYGRLMTLDDNLSLNPNQCHHPLITQLSGKMELLIGSRLLVSLFKKLDKNFSSIKKVKQNALKSIDLYEQS